MPSLTLSSCGQSRVLAGGAVAAEAKQGKNRAWWTVSLAFVLQSAVRQGVGGDLCHSRSEVWHACCSTYICATVWPTLVTQVLPASGIARRRAHMPAQLSWLLLEHQYQPGTRPSSHLPNARAAVAAPPVPPPRARLLYLCQHSCHSAWQGCVRHATTLCEPLPPALALQCHGHCDQDQAAPA